MSLNALKIVFDGEHYPHIKTKIRSKQSKFHLRKVFLLWIE